MNKQQLNTSLSLIKHHKCVESVPLCYDPYYWTKSDLFMLVNNFVYHQVLLRVGVGDMTKMLYNSIYHDTVIFAFNTVSFMILTF